MNINYDRLNYFLPIPFDEDLWNALISIGHKRIYDEGVRLFDQSQVVNSIICLTKGSVKTVHIFPNGNERLLELLIAPSVLGIEALFCKNRVLYPNILTLTQIEIVMVDKVRVEELMLSHPEYFVGFFQIIRSSLFFLRIQSFGASFLSLLQRTAYSLRLITYSHTDQDGYYLITHQNLADFIGISRANVTRCLTELEDMKLITKKRGKIKILDSGGINQLAGYIEIED